MDEKNIEIVTKEKENLEKKINVVLTESEVDLDCHIIGVGSQLTFNNEDDIEIA